jgi:hypothetical protein
MKNITFLLHLKKHQFAEVNIGYIKIIVIYNHFVAHCSINFLLGRCALLLSSKPQQQYMCIWLNLRLIFSTNFYKIFKHQVNHLLNTCIFFY